MVQAATKSRTNFSWASALAYTSAKARSTEPRRFGNLASAMILKTIPGVQAFERLRQVSPKNDYAFGFSMEFADQAAYDAYNTHPDHVAFVRGRWIPEVAAFMEIDYIAI